MTSESLTCTLGRETSQYQADADHKYRASWLFHITPWGELHAIQCSENLAVCFSWITAQPHSSCMLAGSTCSTPLQDSRDRNCKHTYTNQLKVCPLLDFHFSYHFSAASFLLYFLLCSIICIYFKKILCIIECQKQFSEKMP